jgi:signal transduction histidine kinase
MLHEFIAVNREELIRLCRAKVATRSAPPPTPAEIDHGVPMFLDQLGHALRLGLTSSTEISDTAIKHGHDLLVQGFTLSQVVHDYGDISQSIIELAADVKASISPDDFRMLNHCLDDAIAGAVTEYARERNQSVVDEETARVSERLGFMSHEMRNLLNTAIIAFEVLKCGNVGVRGATGAVVDRSLTAARELMSRPLTEVRPTESVQNLTDKTSLLK